MRFPSLGSICRRASLGWLVARGRVLAHSPLAMQKEKSPLVVSALCLTTVAIVAQLTITLPTSGHCPWFTPILTLPPQSRVTHPTDEETRTEKLTAVHRWCVASKCYNGNFSPALVLARQDWSQNLPGDTNGDICSQTLPCTLQ